MECCHEFPKTIRAALFHSGNRREKRQSIGTHQFIYEDNYEVSEMRKTFPLKRLIESKREGFRHLADDWALGAIDKGRKYEDYRCEVCNF